MAHGAARPTVSRRREISGASARSLLTTILGEFVLPRGGSVWTQALVSALALFGMADKSARQANDATTGCSLPDANWGPQLRSSTMRDCFLH